VEDWAEEGEESAVALEETVGFLPSPYLVVLLGFFSLTGVVSLL
jgi:hypothetical protein